MRATRAAGATVIAAALALLAGCAGSDSIAPHSLSDGVLIDMGGGVRGQNLIVLTANQGDPGRLIGTLTNDGDQPVIVTVAIANSQVTPTAVTVPAHGAARFDPSATDILVPASPQPPGAMTDVTLSASSLGSASALVPVLDGTFPQYTPLVPAS